MESDFQITIDVLAYNDRMHSFGARGAPEALGGKCAEVFPRRTGKGSDYSASLQPRLTFRARSLLCLLPGVVATQSACCHADGRIHNRNQGLLSCHLGGHENGQLPLSRPPRYMREWPYCPAISVLFIAVLLEMNQLRVIKRSNQRGSRHPLIDFNPVQPEPWGALDPPSMHTHVAGSLCIVCESESADCSSISGIHPVA